MPSRIFECEWIMRKIKCVDPQEEDQISGIPGFTGEYLAASNAAARLILNFSNRKRAEVWFPFSQLRRTEDGLSIYATNWILDKKTNEIFP